MTLYSITRTSEIFEITKLHFLNQWKCTLMNVTDILCKETVSLANSDAVSKAMPWT